MVKSVKASEKNTKVSKKAPVKAAKRSAPSAKPAVVTSKKYTNMFAAYRAFWMRGFTDWMGTSSRSEYWWTVLANALIFCVIIALMLLISKNGISNWGDAFAGITLLVVPVVYGVAALVPSISMILRRLHDGGFSSWWILLYPVGLFVPYIGYVASLILLVMMLMPTRVDGNPYHKFNN